MRPTTYLSLLFSMFLAVVSIGSPALAEPGAVVLTLSGEAFDGPPQFILRFNGTDIGTGVVATSIDTAKSGRLRDVSRIEPYLETFEFVIPEGVFEQQGTLQVLFPNDAYGGDGLDRNLVIYGVVLNGRAVGTDDIVVTTADGTVQPHELILDKVVLATDGLVATISAPTSGWPHADIAPAKREAAPVSTDQPAPVAEAPAAAEVPATEAVTAPSTEPLVANSLAEPEAPLAPLCDSATIAVTGFGRGLINVPEAATNELNVFARGVSGTTCRVQATGYSSLGGKAEINSSLAKARAAAVLDYLKRKGASFSAEEVISKGETDEFGPTAGENQRVVVTVGP